MIRVRSWMLTAMALLLGVALVGDAFAQTSRSGRREFGRTNGSFLGLLHLESVQKELKLSDEQKAKLKEVGEKIGAEIRQQYAAAREIEDQQKRREKYTELGKQFDEKAHAPVREVLSREQMSRIYQICIQVRGAVCGLNNRYIAGRLELTDEQKKKAAELEKATLEKAFAAYSELRILSELRNLSDEERREKFAELREKVGKIHSQADEQALGLLTAQQKEAFEKMKGEKFEL